MKLVADESVDAQIVEGLRAGSHDVTYLAEFAPGTEDPDVLALASASEALLVTADKDFGELVFRQNQVHAGVVLIRLAGLSAERKKSIVVGAIQQHAPELTGAFAVISALAVRIRRRTE